MSRAEIKASLAKQFTSRSVESALNHFTKMVEDFRAGDWEDATGKGGKFIEAVLKILLAFCNLPVPVGRKFKADNAINAITGTPQDAFPDAIRILMPRAIRFIYDIASNRGARHDPGEVDPNVMDATVTVSCCTWILAEMVRFAEKGAVNLEEARDLIDGLTMRTYPMIEDVEGRVYVHRKEKTAREIALVLLASHYPGRVPKKDLLAGVMRNGFKEGASRMAISRLEGSVDEDENETLRILRPGLHEAEKFLKGKD